MDYAHVFAVHFHWYLLKPSFIVNSRTGKKRKINLKWNWVFNKMESQQTDLLAIYLFIFIFI